MENLSISSVTVLSSSGMTATLLKIQQFKIEKYGCETK